MLKKRKEMKRNVFRYANFTRYGTNNVCYETIKRALIIILRYMHYRYSIIIVKNRMLKIFRACKIAINPE